MHEDSLCVYKQYQPTNALCNINSNACYVYETMYIALRMKTECLMQTIYVPP